MRRWREGRCGRDGERRSGEDLRRGRRRVWSLGREGREQCGRVLVERRMGELLLLLQRRQSSGSAGRQVQGRGDGRHGGGGRACGRVSGGGNGGGEVVRAIVGKREVDAVGCRSWTRGYPRRGLRGRRGRWRRVLGKVGRLGVRRVVMVGVVVHGMVLTVGPCTSLLLLLLLLAPPTLCRGRRRSPPLRRRRRGRRWLLLLLLLLRVHRRVVPVAAADRVVLIPSRCTTVHACARDGEPVVRPGGERRRGRRRRRGDAAVRRLELVSKREAGDVGVELAARALVRRGRASRRQGRRRRRRVAHQALARRRRRGLP